jgi:hypothetical protein
MISARTKAALAASKARGMKLGGPHRVTAEQRERGRSMGPVALRACADAFAAQVGRIVTHLRGDGLSLRQIGAALTSRVSEPHGAALGALTRSRLCWTELHCKRSIHGQSHLVPTPQVHHR